VEHGWNEEWIRPEPAAFRPASAWPSSVGPAGLPAPAARAQRHEWCLREMDGSGAPAYGIPTSSSRVVIDSTTDAAEGGLREGRERGVDVSARTCADPSTRSSGAGATAARDLPSGRDLKGSASRWIPTQQNRRNAGDTIPRGRDLRGEAVVIIGAGTRIDCIGTSAARGRSITQIELLPKPPEDGSDQPCHLAVVLRTSTPGEGARGCERPDEGVPRRREGVRKLRA